MNKLRTNEFVMLISCALMGFVLRSYAFGKKTLGADEICTFQGSRDGIKDQLEFHKGNPEFIYPPLFSQYVKDGSRAWMIASKWGERKI
jgi:hypothetical protein